MEDRDNGTGEAQEGAVKLRCECGVVITAVDRMGLIEKARSHYVDVHPAIGPDVPADLILAMAEEVAHD